MAEERPHPVRDPIRIERVFHALNDGTRRGIVEMLSRKPHSITRLAEPLGISLTAVSQHLQILEEAGLVSTQKLGRVRTASVNTAGLDVLAEWVRERRSMWERKLDKLGEMLAELGDE
jgi:DNA-binding transcriptional ArsR family regulator